jgi:hypothetical protein
VVQLHRESERMKAAGGELIVVGNGKPHWIAGFRDDTGYRGELYTDPSLESYRLAGMKRGIFRWLNPVAGAYAVRALFRGQRQTRVKGDAHQQGGVLVIRPSGEVLYRHADSVAGDLVPIPKIMAALERQAPAAA